MKDKYNLVGIDGNVFSIIAYVKGAMSECAFSNTNIDSFINKAFTAGSYDDVLVMSSDIISKCNSIASCHK